MSSRGRTILFLGVVAVMTLAGVGLVSSTLVMTPETFMISAVWLAGFGFLFFNVSYLFVLSMVRPFLKVPLLKETYVKEFPKIALVYPVRNETHGLFERTHYSFSGNKLPRTDLWILSDSSAEHEPYEREVVDRLSIEHTGHIYYRRRAKPVERKQGNLAEFLKFHHEYTYIYVCDADGMVPEGTLLKLLRKAEHPANRDIAIFQAFVRIAHACTWYSRFERIGTNFAQKFNFLAYQAIFGRTISFGHHHLARTEMVRKIKLPKGLLSHDNWDTALLDRMGQRVAFCGDVHAFDEAPANYLEARARSRRWAQGTLQGIPLIFMPGITLASRFLAFYGIYLYVADLVFIFWLVLGGLLHSCAAGELIHFQIDSIWLGSFTNSVLKWVLIFSIAVVYLHKLSVLRTLKDLREHGYEWALSTLLTLNNSVYTLLDVVGIPLRKLHWRPMRKDPSAGVSFGRVARTLWFGSVAGVYGFYFFMFQTPYFVWQATPILVSLVLSIPVAYGTAKRVPQELRGWI